MGWLLLFSIITSLLGTAAAIGTSVSQNNSNEKSVKDTNATNLEIAQQTNAANVQQAELAFRQSLPANQIANLMAAGLSRQAALSHISGGGTYTAPALQMSQGQAPQKDFSGVLGALERFGNIPSNVQQMQMVNEQRDALRKDTELKEREFELKQQQVMHQMSLDSSRDLREQYGHNVQVAADNLSAEILRRASEYGVDLNSIQSPQDLIDKLHINDSELWTKSPVAARDAALRFARDNAAEYRSNVSSSDEHKISVQRLNDMRDAAHDFNTAKTAREKEYAVRALRADIDSIMADIGITKAEIQREFEIHTKSDGTKVLEPHKGASAVANQFWQTIGSVIGVDYVGEIMARVFAGIVK